MMELPAGELLAQAKGVGKVSEAQWRRTNALVVGKHAAALQPTIFNPACAVCCLLSAVCCLPLHLQRTCVVASAVLHTSVNCSCSCSSSCSYNLLGGGCPWRFATAAVESWN
jgi:hypothetical protein